MKWNKCSLMGNDWKANSDDIISRPLTRFCIISVDDNRNSFTNDKARTPWNLAQTLAGICVHPAGKFYRPFQFGGHITDFQSYDLRTLKIQRRTVQQC